MARIYTGPRWYNGFCSELTLPDDWVSKDDDDGERRFVSHISPAGSRLVMDITTDVRVDYSSRWIPEDERDPAVRAAFMMADDYERFRRADGSMLRWLAGGALRALGRRPELESEQLGACRGFTFCVASGRRAGWYGVFAQAAWIIRVRFVGTHAGTEIGTARGVVGSLRIVREP